MNDAPRFNAVQFGSFLRDKLGFLSQCALNAVDGAVPLWIGEPTYLLLNPEDIRHVLVANAASYDKSWRLTSARGKRLSGSGMQTSFGEAHLRQRRLLQPSFQQRTIERFFDLVAERTRDRMSRWKTCAVYDLAAEFEELALSNILAAVFGKGLSGEPGLAKAITARRRYIEYLYGALVPFAEYLPHPVALRYRSARRVIAAAIDHAVRQAKQGLADPLSFVSLFASARYPGGEVMSAPQLHDEILTMLSTGYETVGDGLAWTLYLLSQHEPVAERVREEVRQVLDGKPLTLEHLPRLQYLRQVLEESMRIYPPTWIFVRMALNDDVLPGGQSIPRGSKIYLCPWVMHRHPRYFPKPERFDPERFTREAKQARPRFAYFPFGAGPRTCIGEPFAIQEMLTVLALVVPQFRFHLRPDPPVVLRPTITLRTVNGIAAAIEPY